MAVFPETGQHWIDNYPDLLQRLLVRWSLRLQGRAQGGWPTNVVFFVEKVHANVVGADEKFEAPTRYVLKFGHPSPESVTESYVLRRGTGVDNGLVDVVDFDLEDNALLLEHIQPGTPLRQYVSEQEAINSALNLHLRVPRAIDDEDKKALPTYRTWMEKAFQVYRSSSLRTREHDAHVEAAETIFAKIEKELHQVLHGDLHHENILKADGGWIAIDPKGVIGPKRMELGRFLHNFLADEIEGETSSECYQAVLEHRFERAEKSLPYSSRELIEVTYVDLTLSTTWHINSEQDADEAAKMLTAVRTIWKTENENLA